MIAFETYINGKKVCRSGIDGAGVHTVIVTHQRKGESGVSGDCKTDIGIAGLDATRNEKPIWLMQALEVGDEIRIVITERSETDSSPYTV